MHTFWKKFNHERVFSLSASLAYVTILGFIPFIIFLLNFLPELKFLHMEQNIQEIVKTIFVPDSAEQIFSYITTITSKSISFNLFSFIVLLLTSYSLFKIINDTFDNILNVHENRKKISSAISQSFLGCQFSDLYSFSFCSPPPLCLSFQSLSASPFCKTSPSTSPLL